MDFATTHHYYIHESQSSSSSPPPPLSFKTQPYSILHSPPASSDTSFPIIAIAIIGILATAFLLVSYYIFVIKCCLNWHRIDILQRFSLSRNRRNNDPLIASSPVIEKRGLDESVIRSIPIFRFQKEGRSKDFGERNYFCECAVCLNEFQEEEKLRIIPNCSHVFHIDCIDVWLQWNDNCPLCRTSISSITRYQTNQIMSLFPPDPSPYNDRFTGRDEDYVVIELQGENSADESSLLTTQERLTSSGQMSPLPRKIAKRSSSKKIKKLPRLLSMGDECINTRNQISVQPLRRSFSMDSSNDQQLYLMVQELVRQKQSSTLNEVSPNYEGCSNRVRRNFFSFGSGRGSRNAVLPVQLDP